MKWLAINPIPSPAPAGWNNPNTWIDCSWNGAPSGGKLTLIDQSTLPPSPVPWNTFVNSMPNPNPSWVPTFDGPMLVGAPDNTGTLSIIINMKKYKWAGYETCTWHGDATGFWQVTGLNFDPDVYPQ